MSMAANDTSGNPIWPRSRPGPSNMRREMGGVTSSDFVCSLSGAKIDGSENVVWYANMMTAVAMEKASMGRHGRIFMVIVFSWVKWRNMVRRELCFGFCGATLMI
mmetsp:Transcript_2882/g.3783  ORF Transcript_2882/g.3783 Transcript_2882/m.3783 type:complete len:105 (-) Transcript_2882:43-357(-)